MFILRLFGIGKPKSEEIIKLPAGGGYYMMVRTMDGIRIAPHMTQISMRTVSFRSDPRKASRVLKEGDQVVVELHLGPEEPGPTFSGRVVQAKREGGNFAYHGTIGFDAMNNNDRRDMVYFLRKVRLRVRTGNSSSHVIVS